ncbi:MAG: hypothetical protein HZB53_08335 [Chloroflexi bacterium]|nr:hypothetical protein [Chloroflexota bacterium]
MAGKDFVAETNRARRRVCIFCGRKPGTKTNEHVIPRWLISMTGDPKRPINVGPFMSQQEPFGKFAFDQFKFPACDNCNASFAKLEIRAKPIVEKLLALNGVSTVDFDILLDWFDKIRIGLWLGFHQYLDQNFWQIVPNFYIAARIGMADRALLIYRTKGAQRGVSFLGVGTPAFAHSPSCFTLVVNDLVIVNASTDFLLARQVGLPYPRSMFVKGDNSLVIQSPLEPGTKEIRYPVLGYNTVSD